MRAAATGKARSPSPDGEWSSAADDQWWRWGRTESPTSLDVRHLTQFIDEVRRCRPVKTCVYKGGTFESNPLRSFQSVQLAEERSNVDELRRRDEPNSSVHHWLETWLKMRWNADQSCITEQRSSLCRLYTLLRDFDMIHCRILRLPSSLRKFLVQEIASKFDARNLHNKLAQVNLYNWLCVTSISSYIGSLCVLF